MNGARQGSLVKLRRDATILGRDKGNIVMSDDTETSSTHCQIQLIGEEYHIFDMNSTNGTFVNNERVLKAKLSDGDAIEIGKTKIIFSMESEANLRNVVTAYQTVVNNQQKRPGVSDTFLHAEAKNKNVLCFSLDVLYNDGVKEMLRFYKPMINIGRASPFGRFDQDSELSRKHLLIKINDFGEIFVEDLNSTNGVFVNNQKIQGMVKISAADFVRIGSNTIFRIIPAQIAK